MSKILKIKDASGNWITVDAITGCTGPRGYTGEPGSDATVTEENITNALGYTPIGESDIPTNVSSFTNDSGYITNSYHDATKQDVISDLATIRSNASSAKSKEHTHSNKALLDTYTQTETDIADAVSKKHEHSNKSVLDATTASFTTETANTINTHSANIVALGNTDTNIKRSLNALWDVTQGTAWDFETDSESGATKTVPTGARLCDVQMVGGKSQKFNQLWDATNIYASTTKGVTASYDSTYNAVKFSGTASSSGYVPCLKTTYKNLVSGHKYYIRCKHISGNNSFNIYIRTNVWAHIFHIGSIGDKIETCTADYNTFTFGADVVKDTEYNDYYQFLVIDLTEIGMENATVSDCESMFPNTNYQYDEGSLHNSQLSKIVVRGRNLLNPNSTSVVGGYVAGGTFNPTNIETFATYVIPCRPNTKYAFTKNIGERLGAMSTTEYPNGTISGEKGISIVTYHKVEITTRESDKYLLVWLYNSSVDTLTYKQIAESTMVEESEHYTEFKPYKETELTFPQEWCNLPCWGVGIGDVYNYVDVVNKKYHQRVGSVDLGSVTWTRKFHQDSQRYYFASNIVGAIVANCLCSKYEYCGTGVTSVITKGIASSANSASIIYIIDNDFDDANTFKTAMSGVILYYELAEEIVTDLTDTIDTPFDVEANGTLQFRYTDDDKYVLAVPSTEEYTIKLSEVTT